MAAPIGSRVEKVCPTMGNSVIDLGLVGIRFSIGLGNALRNDLRITFLVACELAVGTLHTGRILKEIAAECASHDVVELLLDELVAILFMDFIFLLPNSTFAAETNVVCALLLVLLHETHSHVNFTYGLEREPRLDKNWSSLRDRRSASACHGSTTWSSGSSRCTTKGRLLAWRRLKLEIWSYATIWHSVCRHPSRAVKLGLDTFSAHLFCNIGDSNPEHANRHGMVASAVVYSQLNLVGLVNINLMNFVLPSVGLGWLCPAFKHVFDLDYNKGVRSTAKPSGRCMINVRHSLYPNREVACQGLSLRRNVQAVICILVSDGS
jgi:hypothetical protein